MAPTGHGYCSQANQLSAGLERCAQDDAWQRRATPSRYAIVPLTSDRDKLKDAIDEFKASGTTAGQLGTAFAWYLISPNWSRCVAGEESAPAPYGTPKVKKIAILMTDGEYNTLQGKQYDDGSSQATTALTDGQDALHRNEKEGSGKRSQHRGLHGRLQAHHEGLQGDAQELRHQLDDDHYYETSSGDGSEGGVPRHRLEDLAPAADELTH